jgi:hypothetical protein
MARRLFAQSDTRVKQCEPDQDNAARLWNREGIYDEDTASAVCKESAKSDLSRRAYVQYGQICRLFQQYSRPIINVDRPNDNRTVAHCKVRRSDSEVAEGWSEYNLPGLGESSSTL